MGTNQNTAALYLRKSSLDDRAGDNRSITDQRHDLERLADRHFANAVLKEDPRRGSRLTKDRKGSSRTIDACVASIIALHRAAFWRDAAAPSETELLVI